MFDIFTKSDKTKKNKNNSNERAGGGQTAPKASLNFNQSAGGAQSAGIKIFQPNSFDDVATIIDVLIMGKPAIVNLKDLKDSTAQRVLDILCGAIYALKGGLCELETNIYVITPDGVDAN
ncbi:MAG: cell division protein SepF [Clostridia bacterium]|nr:cell division protein SepF [Clostridia bacterium]